MNNTPVPMDLDRARAPTWRSGGRGGFRGGFQVLQSTLFFAWTFAWSRDAIPPSRQAANAQKPVTHYIP